MKTFILGGLLAIVGAMPTVAAALPPGMPKVVARNVTRFDMTSRNSGRTYRIQVYRPSLPPPAEGYPVIFVTDGDLAFNTAADQMHARFLVDLKPAVVVGIGYPSENLWDTVKLRNRDFIPWKPRGAFMEVFQQWGKFGDYTEADTGGAEQFYRFITEELRPRLSRQVKIDSANQALWGHSLGGLFTLYTMFEHPTAFSTYIASSPSILINERQIRQALPAFKSAVEAGKIAPRILLLSGEYEEGAPSALAAMPEDQRLGWTKMGFSGRANTIELADDLMEMSGGPGYEVRKHVFSGENHNSVVPASVARALTFAFSVAPTRMRN